MNIKSLITIDPDVLGGTPVFIGTRVPVESLFDHLQSGISLDEFLEDFPTVTKAQALAVLNENKAPFVKTDPKLNELINQVLFPEKVEKVKQTITGIGLPKNRE